MSAHVHPPGTPAPAGRVAFLVDGCPRCAEYVEDLGCSFDAERYRAFWRKMVEVEWEDAGGWESYLDKQLGRRLYLVSLTFQRAFGVSPGILAEYGERAFVGHPIIVHLEARTEANAALIVKAVNEYDRLREALEKIAHGRVDQRGSLRPSFADAASLARAALEEAESSD